MSKGYERGPVTTKNGHVLTEADFERLADEAEAGYDVTKAKNVRVGRPSLSGGQSHSPRVSFRIANDQRAEAEAEAARQGVTVSALARQAFEEYLAKRQAS